MKLKPKPLTTAEKIWLKKAKALFRDVPARLEFMTSGDAKLDVIDGTLASQSELCDGAAHRDGIVLDSIRTFVIVHGVSG
jgi:hypothetical protein